MIETYLIAVTPPAGVQKRIKRAQAMYHKTGPYHMPAHVTVYPPFNSKLSLTEITELLRIKLTAVSARQLTWNSYGFFEGKNNVFYFKPDSQSTVFLKSIFTKTLQALIGNISDAHDGYATTHHDYHPHITIAEHLPIKKLIEIKKQAQKVTPPLRFFASRVDIYQRNPNSKTYTKVQHVRLQKVSTR